MKRRFSVKGLFVLFFKKVSVEGLKKTSVQEARQGKAGAPCRLPPLAHCCSRVASLYARAAEGHRDG